MHHGRVLLLAVGLDQYYARAGQRAAQKQQAAALIQSRDPATVRATENRA